MGGAVMAEALGREVDETIETAQALRAVLGAPSERVQAKVIDRIDEGAARYIAASPFAALATRRADGGVDVTPRGDPPGFAKVLDSKTLALPERPGNRRADALLNLLEDPRLGLLFMIPGVTHTLRVSGEARLVRDAALGEAMAVNGRAPELIVLVRVERVLSHCSKAFVRSALWRPESWAERPDVPSLAELMAAHTEMGLEVAFLDAVIERDARERLY
ncbi:MAG: MSMEG_1061 family FMN-dependent PPOX-type flavoprotein [Pseudomonadota bacterium]